MKSLLYLFVSLLPLPLMASSSLTNDSIEAKPIVIAIYDSVEKNAEWVTIYIHVAIENKTQDTVSSTFLCCSYDDCFISDNKSVEVSHGSCDSCLVIGSIKIAPNQSCLRRLALSVVGDMNTLKSKPFRVGFDFRIPAKVEWKNGEEWVNGHKGGNPDPYLTAWSNEITIK
jgi:hypothetical protein